MRDSVYWVALAPGCALGYRKGPKGGVWVAKMVRDGVRQQTTLGPADDALDPDGVLAISYAQAQAKAREWFAILTRPARSAGPYTVGDAVSEYLDWFRATGRKSVKETEASVRAFILPQLGDQDALSLTPARLRKWHAEIAAAPPRLRTRPGEKQKVRHTADDPEAARRRNASANRILTILKAALNHAWREGKIPSDEAWRRVVPFREADAARVRYLDREECRRLVNASPEPLRAIVRGALLSGARYSELARMQVADYVPTMTNALAFGSSGVPGRGRCPPPRATLPVTMTGGSRAPHPANLITYPTECRGFHFVVTIYHTAK